MENEVIQLVSDIKAEIQAKLATSATKQDIADLSAKLVTLEEKGVKLETIAKMQEQLDDLSVKSKRNPTQNDLKAKILADLEAGIKSITNGQNVKGSFNLPYLPSDLKIVGTMLVSTNTTNAIPQDWQSEILKSPYRAVRMRSLIPVAPTSSDTVRYIVKSGKEGAVATRAEGAIKGQIDWNYAAQDAVVRSIAGFLVISKEMLSDMPYLTSELSMDLPEELRDVEDTQILTGDNQSPNLNGLLTAAGTFDGAGLYVATPNEYDVLVAAVTQITLLNYRPTAILLNPTDYSQLMLTRASHYNFVPQADLMQVMGVPIISNTAMTAGSFLVGDFVRGAKLHEREGVRVEFFEQDSTNVRYNLVTVRVEERVALAVKHPTAFVTGAFLDAKAILDNASTATTTS
jgi:HK97 family phage major capsid protein